MGWPWGGGTGRGVGTIIFGEIGPASNTEILGGKKDWNGEPKEVGRNGHLALTFDPNRR